jgi:hypothetical protein
MNEFSQYCSFEELTNSASHKDLVAQNRIDAMKFLIDGVKLSKLVEVIRGIFGNKPLNINSGFRNSVLNKAVGSKFPNSAHTIFQAADVTPDNMSVEDAFNVLMIAHKKGLIPNLRKVLHEGTWLHIEVSTKPGDYRGFFKSLDGNKTFIKVA